MELALARIEPKNNVLPKINSLIFPMDIPRCFLQRQIHKPELIGLNAKIG
jgi:hypothetical protein